MKQDKKLMLKMSLLFLIVFVVFGVIIVNDKLYFYYLPKIEKKLNKYIENNYKDEKYYFSIGKAKYKNGKYYLKVSSTENKDLYFYIYYNNKKISNTYRQDYKKGNTLLKTLEKKEQSLITKKINTKVKVNFTTTLDNYSKKIRRKIISEDNIEKLKILKITFTKDFDKLDEKSLENELININNTLKKNNIYPKYINVKVNTKTSPKNQIEIKNITPKSIENSSFKEEISDIINKKKK